MIPESKKLEFWNFLINEKNQPRPKGITVQRLAVIRPAILGLDDLWKKLAGRRCGAVEMSAVEFFGSDDGAAIESRAEFWEAVRKAVRHSDQGAAERQSRPPSGNAQSRRSASARKKSK